MTDITQMLEQLESQLEQRAAVSKTNAQPDTPTAIVYAGRRSLEAQPDIEQTLRRVWRGRADAVCHFLMERDGYARCTGGQAMGAMTESEVVDRIESMFGDDRSFHKLSNLFLVLIQDTEQYRELAEFRRDYLEADAFADRMDNGVTVMKIVLLDESNRGKELANQIRGFLRERIQSSTESNRSTVILSNRLRNGQLLKNRMLRENYILAGGIILTANGYAQGFEAAYSTMFPLNSRDMLTASYSRIPRPNRDICEVMVNTLLEWLISRFERAQTLKISDISNRLDMTGGVPKTMSECFKRSISGNMLPREALECLPRSAQDLGVIGSQPFDQFNRMTMGSFDLFFRQNAEPLCRAEGVLEQFRREFREFVQSKFTPREAAFSLTPQNIDAVLEQISISEPSGKLPAYSYMCKLMETRFYAAVLPVCREVLEQISQEAQRYIAQLRSLVDEFNQNYMLDVLPTVRDHYEPLVRHDLDGELGLRLLELMNRERLDDQGLLKAVYDTLVTITRSHEIFTLPLAEEMECRLGGNKNLMQSTIRQILLDCLSEKIRLKSSISPSKSMDVLLLDTNCEVFGFLQDMYPDMLRLNTSNGSTVELIQFFRVGETVI